MKSGPFIQAIADAYRVEAKTVRAFARLLREAGLLTTGARGLNAPDMTARDAAILTIALLATNMPARAVEAVETFSALTYNPSMSDGDTPLSNQENYAATLEEALTEFFTTKGIFSAFMKSIELNRPMRNVYLTFRDGTAVFDGTAEEVSRLYSTREPEQLQIKGFLTAPTMLRVAYSVAGFDAVES
jgi:patatin-like phospholipase/acyl hydrolase